MAVTWVGPLLGRGVSWVFSGVLARLCWGGGVGGPLYWASVPWLEQLMAEFVTERVVGAIGDRPHPLFAGLVLFGHASRYCALGRLLCIVVGLAGLRGLGLGVHFTLVCLRRLFDVVVGRLLLCLLLSGVLFVAGGCPAALGVAVR